MLRLCTLFQEERRRGLGTRSRAEVSYYEVSVRISGRGKAYYRAYSGHLIKEGYLRTTSYPCLFVKLDGPRRTYVWCHVDDTFVCCTKKGDLKIFQDCVAKKFKIRVREYLGIQMDSLASGDMSS
jgi:hypothetical protein